MAGEIDEWQEQLDLKIYRDAFADDEIAFGNLSELTEVDLSSFTQSQFV